MTVLYVHPDLGPAPDEGTYCGLLDLLRGITPVVEALPPDAALLDVRGAVRYFGRDPGQLAELIRVRMLALYGVRCTVGVAPNRLLATMAARSGPPDGIRAVGDDPDAVAAFLGPQPVAALCGVGPSTVRTLTRHGLHTVGDVAHAGPLTLQRLFGAAEGRRLHTYARGADPRPVTPGAPAPFLTEERDFPLDTVDAGEVTRSLLDMTVRLGSRLRSSEQVAHALALTVRYAGRSATTRSRTLPQPTAATYALTRCAYRIHESLGLQRARVRGTALRADGLTPAASTPAQLSLDPADERARRLEAAMDRFGPSVVHPARLLPPRSGPED